MRCPWRRCCRPRRFSFGHLWETLNVTDSWGVYRDNEEFYEIIKHYENADFIFGRDGGLNDELLLLLNWANHSLKHECFPGQMFSVCGKQQGFNDNRGNLFFKFICAVAVSIYRLSFWRM